MATVGKYILIIALIGLGLVVLLTLALFLGPTSHEGNVGPTTTRVIAPH